MYHGAIAENESDLIIGRDGISYSEPVSMDNYNSIDPTAFLCKNEDCTTVLCIQTASDTAVVFQMQRANETTYYATSKLFLGMKPPRFEEE